MMLVLFSVLTAFFVILPFIPCILEALWGQDIMPTPVTDHQLVDLRDDPYRVWSLLELNPPKHFKSFEEETLQREQVDSLYCHHSLKLNQTERLWELHVKEDLIVQYPLVVAWWMTARNIIISGKVDAVGKIQAQEKLKISAFMQFHQLQAGVIEIGVTGSLLDYQTPSSIDYNRQVVKGNWTLATGSEVQGDFIVHGDVVLEEGSTLQGSLKVWGRLWLRQGAQISGNVFVTKSAVLQEKTAIGGVMVVEEDLQCLGSNVFGSSVQPTTIIANNITIAGGVRVYGVLKAWQRGVISIDKHLHGHLLHPNEQTCHQLG